LIPRLDLGVVIIVVACDYFDIGYYLPLLHTSLFSLVWFWVRIHNNYNPLFDLIKGYNVYFDTEVDWIQGLKNLQIEGSSYFT